MKPALAPGPAHLGRTAGRSDGPRNRVPPNVPPPVLHVLSPVLAVLSKVTPWLSPACGPCAHALVYMEAPVLCRDSAEFCRAVGPHERALASGKPPPEEIRFHGSESLPAVLALIGYSPFAPTTRLLGASASPLPFRNEMQERGWGRLGRAAPKGVDVPETTWALGQNAPRVPHRDAALPVRPRCAARRYRLPEKLRSG